MSRHVPPEAPFSQIAGFDTDRPRLTRGEAAGVAHVGPRERLDVGEQLTEMIPVMVDPLVEQVADGQKPDLRVVAPALEVGGAEAGDQGDAVPAEPGELVNERIRGLLKLPPLRPVETADA